MIENNKHITELLIRMYGIDVSKYDNSFLNRSLKKRITKTHCSSVEEYASILEQNRKEGESFLDSLHISYSEFFRNTLTYAVLERIVLPSIVQKKKNSKHKEIRIWSAASAAGQEAYSLAILLEELKNDDVNKFDYLIFATDQCELQLAEAQKGKYSASVLNNMNLKRLERWFTKHEETYFVKPELKKHVDFSVFDLFNEKFSSPPASIFGDFDLVVCANLLFYYNFEFREIIIKKIGNCVAAGGFLITGESEREILLNHNYNEVFSQSAIFCV